MRERLTLSDGAALLVRPIQPGDRELLRDAFERLSAESRYRRFFTPIDKVSEEGLTYLTEVDHTDHEALVAIDEQTGGVVGVARYVRDATAPERAEAAVTVVDDWQRRGVGRMLLERLTDRAREQGITRFTARVQADNRQALQLMSGVGEAAVRQEGPEVALEIELPAERGVGPGLAAALRAAAAGALPVRSLLHRLLQPRSGRRYEMGDAIVVGTDGSETARTAVGAAAELARATGAPLHVLSAYRPVPEYRLRQERTDAPDDLEWRINAKEDVQALLRETADELEASGVSLETHAREGDPAEALLDVAEELAARLIVVGNKGMSGARRFLLGSVPNKVSHHAPCNVLIVRTT